MPRPKKPSALLEASGAYRKDPQRRPKNEPVVKSPVGNCPDEFNEDQRKRWNQIVREAPPGVLTGADRMAVVQLSILTSEMFEKGLRGTMAVPRMQLMNKLLGQFGMTPADRSKISLPDKPADNPFTKLG